MFSFILIFSISFLTIILNALCLILKKNIKGINNKQAKKKKRKNKTKH